MDEQESPRPLGMGGVIAESEGLVQTRSLNTSFEIEPSPGDQRITHLLVTADVVDRDEVMDLVIDGTMEFQLEDGLPPFVVPLCTSDREVQVQAPRSTSPI